MRGPAGEEAFFKEVLAVEAIKRQNTLETCLIRVFRELAFDSRKRWLPVRLIFSRQAS
jgi:hypothetical protein